MLSFSEYEVGKYYILNEKCVKAVSFKRLKEFLIKENNLKFL